MSKKERLPGEFAPWMVPAWSSRALSIAVSVMLVMQITYYCTNALGMNAGLVGTLLLVSKLFDGFTDLVAGVIIDKTNTRFGKARPYELCIIGVWVCVVLLFSCPADISMALKSIYVFVFYTLTNSVFATMLNASDAVYLGRVVNTQDGQAKIMSFNAPVIMVFATIMGIAMPMLIAKYGAVEGGWTTIAMTFAVPFGIIGLGRFFFLKELDFSGGKKSPEITMKLMLDTLKTNKYVFIISMAMLLTQLVSGIASAVNIYFFQYIYGNIAAASTLALVSLVTPFILIFFPKIMRKFSLTQIAILGAVAGIIGNLIKLVAPTNMTVLFIGSLVGSIAALPLGMLINIFLIECMDYGEWKNNIRVEGVVGAIGGFANKIGSGLASVFVGFAMQFAGFNAAVEVQPDSANFIILALFTWIPALLFLIQIFVLKKYDLYKQIGKIREDLATRR